MVDIVFKQYPRGFLGKPLAAQYVKKRTALQARQGNLNAVINVFQPQTNTLDPNPDVDSLYNEWIDRGAEVVNFDFREKVLIVAMDAFGTADFRRWYEAQLLSPVYGDLHGRFLEDTLQFIEIGQRTMSLQNWMALVNERDTGERQSVLGDKAKAFFGIPVPGFRDRRSQNEFLLPIIQQWNTHPSGFEDLLLTLHILFGAA